MKMPSRCIFYLAFHIDTNRLNSRQGLPFMNKLEQWRDDGVIHIDMSITARQEALNGGSLARKQQADNYIYAFPEASTPNEQETLRKIGAILFPNGGQGQSQINDVYIIFTAWKYGRILVTNDGDSRRQPGGILGNADELKREIDAKVMRDSDAVSLIENEIEQRDSDARKISEITGEPLPDWVGKD